MFELLFDKIISTILAAFMYETFKNVKNVYKRSEFIKIHTGRQHSAPYTHALSQFLYASYMKMMTISFNNDNLFMLYRNWFSLNFSDYFHQHQCIYLYQTGLAKGKWFTSACNWRTGATLCERKKGKWVSKTDSN